MFMAYMRFMAYERDGTRVTGWLEGAAFIDLGFFEGAFIRLTFHGIMEFWEVWGFVNA